MTELDKVWKDCLRMWKWIAKEYNRTAGVSGLKRQWLKKHGFTEYMSGNCFFCEYVRNKGGGCFDCPAVLVDEYFECDGDKHCFATNPVDFYAEILRLNTIRTEGK